MKQNSAKLFWVSIFAAQLGGLFLLPAEVFARVGGGQSYGGGRGHGDGGGGAGAIIWLLFQFVRMRKFDPNFSEIVFTDFCYALYAKGHDARGHGAAALELFSPYLSESAR